MSAGVLRKKGSEWSRNWKKSLGENLRTASDGAGEAKGIGFIDSGTRWDKGDIVAEEQVVLRYILEVELIGQNCTVKTLENLEKETQKGKMHWQSYADNDSAGTKSQVAQIIPLNTLRYTNHDMVFCFYSIFIAISTWEFNQDTFMTMCVYVCVCIHIYEWTEYRVLIFINHKPFLI